MSTLLKNPTLKTDTITNPITEIIIEVTRSSTVSCVIEILIYTPITSPPYLLLRPFIKCRMVHMFGLEGSGNKYEGSDL